jgi:hypothetical protein
MDHLSLRGFIPRPHGIPEVMPGVYAAKLGAESDHLHQRVRDR